MNKAEKPKEEEREEKKKKVSTCINPFTKHNFPKQTSLTSLLGWTCRLEKDCSSQTGLVLM